LGDRQTFTGSVNITGSLALAGNITSNGTAVVLGSGTSSYLPKFTGASTIGNSLLTDNGTNIGLGVANPTAGRLQINVSDTTTAAHLQIVDGTTTLANSFVTNFRNANDGDGRYSLSRWQVQNAVGNDQNGFIGVQSVTGAGAYTPNIVFGQRTGVSTYATRMTLDASGHLGLGVTPSAWYTGYTALQVGFSGAIFSNRTSADTNITMIGNNAFLNSGATNWIYQNTGFATRYTQVSGGHEFYTAASGTAGNAISFTQAMTLTAAGNLGIGTSNPTSKFEIYDNVNSAILRLSRDAGNARGQLQFGRNNGGSFQECGTIIVDSDTASVNNGVMYFYTSNSSGTNTERMRITSAGVLDLPYGQIKFPATQNPSADANTLDDYEEGTWTPVIGGSGGQSGQSYSGQNGYYVKIGRQVTVTFRVVLSNKGTITGEAGIKNLPFTADTTISYGTGASFFEALATSWSSIFFVVNGNTTFASVDGLKTAGTTSTRATTSDIGNLTQFNGSFTYLTT
jgi:hypothetical protein